MKSLILFVGCLVAIVAVTGGWAVYRHGFAHFRTEEGKKDFLGILKGILLAVVFAALVGGLSLLSGCSGTWFNDASVYAGLDSTKKLSPMCEEGGGRFDDKTTSNLGIRSNIYQMDNFTAYAKYTHHSCAYGVDDDSYDALGVELEYKFWER